VSVPAEVTAVSENQITVTLSAAPNGVADITVHNTSKGFAIIDPSASFSYNLFISSISPNKGSLGGAMVMMRGGGFTNNSRIFLGVYKCIV
jgi:hypothetical protein